MEGDLHPPRALTRSDGSPLEQHVVQLDLEDRDGDEIAGELGTSRSNVRVVRHRALEKLPSAPKDLTC